MKIRTKIIAVVIPILFVTLGISGIWAYLSATSGITKIALELLVNKVEALEKEADKQWSYVEDLNYKENPEYVEVTKAGIALFAINMIKSKTEITELIFAFDKDAEITMQTGEIELSDDDKKQLKELFASRSKELQEFSIAGIDRVGMGFYFEPFEWYYIVTEEKKTFYQDVERITWQTGILLLSSCAVAFIILFFIINYLTKPLIGLRDTMREIISSGNLDKRVPVEFHDETGQLAHTFNIMVGELEKAYNQIKSYAFKAVLAQKKESRIRNIFQKYVPQELIDKYYEHPEAMLVGDNRVLAVLFSDIRGFTSIAESMLPDEIVHSLNRYFTIMVDVIMNRKGIVDKYIGDAIMAFFGAPVKHENDALQSALAAIEMIESLVAFNKEQHAAGKPPFRIGVGLNYGVVTVGNIGTEKKMEYTVIGDMVNLASRLEGLTKVYKQQVIVSESIKRKAEKKLSFRLLDTVAVKGKKEGVKIFSTQRTLTPREKEAWEINETAFSHFYNRDFEQAANLFKRISELIKNDHPSELLLRRCKDLMANPPAKSWTGIKVMEIK
jgi:adenylate cyclase